MFNKVTEKWTKKAEEWIDEQSTRLFDTKGYEDSAEDAYDDARASADKARDAAEAARQKARQAQQRAVKYGDDELGDEGLDAMYDDDGGTSASRKRQKRA